VGQVMPGMLAVVTLLAMQGVNPMFSNLGAAAGT
jgi:hypothetical protein